MREHPALEITVEIHFYILWNRASRRFIYFLEALPVFPNDFMKHCQFQIPATIRATLLVEIAPKESKLSDRLRLQYQPSNNEIKKQNLLSKIKELKIPIRTKEGWASSHS